MGYVNSLDLQLTQRSDVLLWQLDQHTIRRLSHLGGSSEELEWLEAVGSGETSNQGAQI
jgi:hypothetical protein